MAEGVREQVVEDALDLLGLAPHPGAVAHARLHPHLPRVSFRLETSDARFDEGGQLGVPQLERQRAGVDACELEEVVYEPGEAPHLLVHRGQVAVRRRNTVLDRLQHRLQRRDRRAQVVARPRDELATGVEDPVQVLRHLVERSRQVGELGRAALGGARAQVAGGQRGRGDAEPVDARGDLAGQQERGDHRGGRGRGRNGEDLHVVAHVEHDPAGEQDGSEGQDDGEEGEPDELHAERGEEAQPERDHQPDHERRERDEDGELDHGANL